MQDTQSHEPAHLRRFSIGCHANTSPTYPERFSHQNLFRLLQRSHQAGRRSQQPYAPFFQDLLLLRRNRGCL